MKKELIAAVLLAVIFAGVMLNIRASEKICLLYTSPSPRDS